MVSTLFVALSRCPATVVLTLLPLPRIHAATTEMAGKTVRKRAAIWVFAKESTAKATARAACGGRKAARLAAQSARRRRMEQPRSTAIRRRAASSAFASGALFSLYLPTLSLPSLSLTHAHAPSLARYCNSTLKATLPKRAWTLNIDAVEGSEEDSYRFNPWRAPGHAPVVDPCGQAGGEYGYQHLGGDSVFYNTSMSSMGMRGSELPATPSALRPTWTAGTSVEVAWGARYNHGFVCCCCCECS